MYKPIEEIDIFTGKVDRIFYSITAATNELKLSYNQILRLIKKQEIYKRHLYKFYYAEDAIVDDIKYPIQQIDPATKKIINQYKTITEAARDLNYNRNAISKCIHTGELDRYGYC